MEPKSILLVDDEPLVVQSLAREMRLAHIGEVVTALSGEEAIQVLENQDFDLVVTDLNMPGKDGFQVLKAAKARSPRIIVLILTGYANMKYAIDCLRLGADDFLQKPCDPDELFFRIANNLKKQELQRKVEAYEQVLPMCSVCKRIRDDWHGKPGQGRWHTLEEYLLVKKGMLISHGCCPECFGKAMEELENH